MSVDESRPTSVASTLCPSAPTRVIAAGARRKTCAAVTTSPGCQTTAVASVPRRPRTAKVLAATRSTSAASASEWAANAGLEGSGAGPAGVLLFMGRLGSSGRQAKSTRLPAAPNPPNGGRRPGRPEDPRWCARSRFASPRPRRGRGASAGGRAAGRRRSALDRIAIARIVVQRPVGVVQAPGDGPRPGGERAAVDLAIGSTPPPVELRKTSSAAARSAAGTGATRSGMASAPHSSITVLREMPSSTPRSAVRTTPSLTMKTLKPGPSATLPSASTTQLVSAPRS